MKHTPGPWDTSVDAVPDGHVQITVHAGDGTRVATAFEEVANSWLIAAAPEMLAALQRIYEGSTGELDADGNDPGLVARAAIQKATGS